MEISAEKAHNTAKPAYDVKCAKQIKSIFKQIESCARKGEFSCITEVIYPENEAELEKLGYRVTHGFRMSLGEYTTINWRNV